MMIAIFQLAQSTTHKYYDILFSDKELSPKDKRLLTALPDDKKASDVIHWCMIPMVNESYDILHDTIKALKDSNYDLSKLAVTVNGEAAKKEHFMKVWEELEKEFTGVFGYFDYTLHVLAEDEMIGK